MPINEIEGLADNQMTANCYTIQVMSIALSVNIFTWQV